MKNNMKRQNVIITDNATEVNRFLEQGWKVISVTPQHVSAPGQGYSSQRGGFCFVIEKDEAENGTKFTPNIN